MAVNPCHSQRMPPQSFTLDRTLIVKTWVYNATDLFVEFCTSEATWHYLEKHQNNLFPLLKAINAFCASTKDSSISKAYLESISTLLEKDRCDIGLYINITQDIKTSQQVLLKTHCNIVHNVAQNHTSDLLEAHFQTIHKICELRPTLLEIYLKIIEKYSLNNIGNLLTHHIYGVYTSLNILEKDIGLKELFFQGVDNIRHSQPALLDLYLRNVYVFCNSSHQSIIKRFLESSSHIFFTQPHIFENYLSNVNSLPLSSLENYISISSYMRNSPQALNLHIRSTSILKEEINLIEAHQKNLDVICKLQSSFLENYFTFIIYLSKNARSSLDDYIQSFRKIDDSQNDLQKHLQIINNVHRFKPDLLKVHVQNTCKLNRLNLNKYIESICSRENFRDNSLAIIIYYANNEIHLSDLRPDLVNLYFLSFQMSEGYSANVLNHSYNIHYIIKKNIDVLPIYLETVLFLREEHPSLSTVNLENTSRICRVDFDFLHEYLCLIIENIGIQEFSFFSFYVSRMQNASIILERYPEVTDLYYDTYTALEDIQENSFRHVRNFHFISQESPDSIKRYLEITLLLQNTKPTLCRLHLKNTENICCSKPNLLRGYLLSLFERKDDQTQLTLYIRNAFNKYAI